MGRVRSQPHHSPIYRRPSKRGGHSTPRELSFTPLRRPGTDSQPREQVVPYLRMSGKWLQRLGFKHGDRVIVTGERRRLVITIAREE